VSVRLLTLGVLIPFHENICERYADKRPLNLCVLQFFLCGDFGGKGMFHKGIQDSYRNESKTLTLKKELVKVV
jgi:hypothetical protein